MCVGIFLWPSPHDILFVHVPAWWYASICDLPACSCQTFILYCLILFVKYENRYLILVILVKLFYGCRNGPWIANVLYILAADHRVILHTNKNFNNITQVFHNRDNKHEPRFNIGIWVKDINILWKFSSMRLLCLTYNTISCIVCGVLLLFA